MSPFCCYHPGTTVPMPPSRCHHHDATILTQLYWCHLLNTTLLIQSFSCCYPQFALLMLLSSHCHWNFIVAYKIISKNNIKRTYSFSGKLEKRKTKMVWDTEKYFKKLVFLTAQSWYHCPDAAVLMLPSRGNHSDAAVMTSLSWGCCPDITILRKPSWCHPPDTAILMLLSSTCPSHARISALSPNIYCCM